MFLLFIFLRIIVDILEPLALFLSIYTGFNFAMIFSFFGSYNYVYRAVYHFTQKEVGLAFLGLVVGKLFKS
jgi:hypothetical protein